MPVKEKKVSDRSSRSRIGGISSEVARKSKIKFNGREVTKSQIDHVLKGVKQICAADRLAFITVVKYLAG